MITTPSRLERICSLVSTLEKNKEWPVNLSHQMYRRLTTWQYNDRFPNLLAVRSRGTYYLVRVR